MHTKSLMTLKQMLVERSEKKKSQLDLRVNGAIQSTVSGEGGTTSVDSPASDESAINAKHGFEKVCFCLSIAI
jgi:hypothetical protein